MDIEMTNSLVEIVSNSLKKRLVIKPYTLETFQHAVFPFVVGLYQEAKTTILSPFMAVYTSVLEGTFFNEIFFEIFGSYPGDKKRPSQSDPLRRSIRFYSTQIAEVICGITGDNKYPPNEILTDQNKKLLYLKGFLYRGAKVYSEFIWLRRKEKNKEVPRARIHGRAKIDLLRRVQELLHEFQINTVNRRNGFAVYRLESLKQLIRLNLI